jgi:hypothetical protein
MEVMNILKQTGKIPRILAKVTYQAHQQAGASGDCNPPLFSCIPITAMLV